MRWTADEFWHDRVDVVPTSFLTENDVLRSVFLVGATEAEVVHSDPEPGDATVYVRGLRGRTRRALARNLAECAPLGHTYRVKKLKGKR